jgi:hypothetical protein
MSFQKMESSIKVSARLQALFASDSGAKTTRDIKGFSFDGAETQ